MVLRIRYGVLAALLVCSTVSACAWWGGDKSPITIGAIYNLNGVQSALDIPSSEGARLAVDRANKDGGVLGRKIRLDVIDGQSTPRYITEVTGNLLAKKPSIVGLIGLSDTDMVLAAAPVAARYKKVFLTSGASSPRLP